MQVIMVPAYSVVVFWKALCAVRLGMDPNSLWLLMQVLRFVFAGARDV